MFDDTNLWMVDTAMYVHTMPHKIVMVPDDNQSSQQVITLGKETIERTEKSGRFKELFTTKKDWKRELQY